jgi:dTDP-4-dehydrorhamnose 3,5-epimerase
MHTSTVSSVQRVDTLVPGVFALWPKVFRDSRGFFTETYHQAEFATLGITDQFVQDSHSCSCKGTLRGLHYQLRHPQAKLCRVVEGKRLTLPSTFEWGLRTSENGQASYFRQRT